MPQWGDLGGAMTALDEFLLSDRAPEQCMMLSDLDGFLTGIVVGPEFLPPSEWLPAIWGGEEPVFDDAAHAQSILGAIMGRYNEILEAIEEGAIAPIFLETADGGVIAADWAEGFMQAVFLRPDAWEKMLRSDQGSALLLPIAALCSGEEGESLLELSPELVGRFADEAADLVPTSVLGIAEYWRADRTESAPLRSAPKIGRNDPCPCGSGKKFKKCCGSGV